MNLIYINDDNLILFNKKGIFPFPAESEENFLQRAQTLIQQSSKSKLDTQVREDLKNLFDIDPDWIDFEYSNQGLHFWEAAYVEISPPHFIMRLKKKFKNQETFLGIYSRREILAHECVHLGRMNLKAAKYEEILAYKTSKRFFRKLLGALFGSPQEVMVLLVMSAASVFSDVMDLFKFSVICKITLLIFVSFLVSRLFYRKKIIKRVLKKLEGVGVEPNQSLAILYRLSDREIDLFFKSSNREIRQFIQEQIDLRWQMIKKAYFFK